MKPHLWVVLLFIGSAGASACNNAGTSTGGAGTGAGSTATCPQGPQDCTTSKPCPQGSYCLATDPCGDNPTCMPLPAACSTTPTCDCLMAQNPSPPLTCSDEAAAIFAYTDGDSPCCP